MSMKLSNKNIDKTVQDIQELFEKVGVSKKDVIKICLIFEESLLRFKENFSEEQEFTVSMKKWFSVAKVVIRVKGEPFDPLQNSVANEVSAEIFTPEIMQSLLNYEGVKTVYRYENGYNELIVSSTKEKKPVKIPGGKTTIAILAAIVFSFLNQYLPLDAQKFLLEECTPLLIKTFMGVIVAVTGPFIFISIVSGILAIDNIDTLSKVGLTIIRRFISITLVMSIITAFVCQLFYPVLVFESGNSFALNQLIDLFVNIVPTNLFTPFTEGKVLQIVVIAVLTSICILLLGNNLKEIYKLTNELKLLITKMLNVVSQIIIVTIFLSIYKSLSTSSFESITQVGGIIAINYIVIFIVSLIMLLRISINYKITIKEFFKKTSKILLISLATASNTAAMSKNFEVVVNDLKIEARFCNFWLPLSYTIFSPSAASALVICVFYTAAFSGNAVAISDLLMTLFLALQLSMATPPVPGGIMPIYVMILGQLNLPTDSIGFLMMASVFVLNFSSFGSMIIRDCELIDVSHTVNLDKQ